MSDDFTLNAEQMAFMDSIEAAAEVADKEDDYAFFDALVASQEWRALFGAMGWDQAYDRWEMTARFEQ